MPRPTDADLNKAARLYLALWQETGARPTKVTPTDLERFDLAPWDGYLYGMQCVKSPIVEPER